MAVTLAISTASFFFACCLFLHAANFMQKKKLAVGVGYEAKLLQIHVSKQLYNIYFAFKPHCYWKLETLRFEH